jgi:hypothetical protein
MYKLTYTTIPLHALELLLQGAVRVSHSHAVYNNIAYTRTMWSSLKINNV